MRRRIHTKSQNPLLNCGFASFKGKFFIYGINGRVSFPMATPRNAIELNWKCPHHQFAEVTKKHERVRLGYKNGSFFRIWSTLAHIKNIKLCLICDWWSLFFWIRLAVIGLFYIWCLNIFLLKKLLMIDHTLTLI